MASVSIIIPYYNQSFYLLEAIDSVLNQSLKDFEIIVIDDGSTDDPAGLYEKLENNTNIFLYKQNNQGAAAARNLGVNKATKEYLAFLDADDLWFADKIKTQLKALNQTQADMIFTRIEQFISPDLMTESLAKLAIKNKVIEGLCPSTMLIKNDIFHKIGYFNPKLHLGEFIAWYLKSKILHLKPYVMPQTLARRRIHKNNTSYRNQSHRNDYLKIFHQHFQEET